MRSLGAILLIVAALGYAAWRIGRTPADSGAESVRPEWTGARVDEARGLTVMRLAGTPREKGIGHGERLRTRIRALFEAVKPSDPGLSAFAVTTCGQQIGPRLPAPYREEIEGIAEGAGLAFDEVLYLNTRFDLRAYELAGGSGDGIGFGEAAGVGSGPEVLRLFDPADLDGRAQELVVFVHLDEVPTVLVGMPGMVGGFLGARGIEARVGAALRPIQGAPTPVLTGLPWPLFLRRLLESPVVPGDPLPAPVTLEASIAFVPATGPLGTLDVSPRGAAWHSFPGDYAVAQSGAIAGEGTQVEERELDASRLAVQTERARRVMAGQVPARLVGVRLRASPGGVVATVYRDGVRFARSIRYRD